MEKIIEATKNIEEYYNSVKEYINNAKPLEQKFEKIHKLIKSSSKSSDLESKFQNLNQYILVSYLLKEIYDLLHLPISENDDISRTNALRINESFAKITKLYKTYIQDVISHSEEVVMNIYEELKSLSLDPKELTMLWHKYPQSIQLYSLLIQDILDKNYKERNFDKVQEIVKILDDDKRFILEEKEFISPFLTFNLRVGTTFPPAPPLLSEKFLKNNDKEDNFLEDNENDIQKQGRKGGDSSSGEIIIRRHKTNNIIYNMPQQSFLATKGVTEKDIFHLYTTLENTSSLVWKWDITIKNPKADQFRIIEDLGVDKRFLVPFAKQSKPEISKDDPIIKRILNHEFGRPYAFYTEVDKSLTSAIDERVANLSSEDSQHEVVELGLNIMDLSDLMIKKFSTMYVEGPAILEDYEKHIFKVLELYVEDAPMDLVFLWIEKSKAEFKKELNLIKWDSQTDHSKIIHDLIAKILKKNNNIFQDLIAKIHKLKLIESFSGEGDIPLPRTPSTL